VQSDKSAHIDTMVQEQKYHPPKRLSRIKHPAHRWFVKAPPQMSSEYYSSSYNSSNVQQGTFLPASLQERICKIVSENPEVILQNFSEMCSLTNSTFCIHVVLLKAGEHKCMKFYKMIFAGSASPDH
jgi:hypothetical protein